MDKNNFPYVSFVIPTYNAEKTIKDCLESIFLQDYPSDRFEVIVLDGSSLDRTIEIAKKYNVELLLNKKPPPYNQEGRDGGKALGFNSARGELVVFLDADNILATKDWLEKMIESFVRYPDLVACESSRYPHKNDTAINRYCSALVTQTPHGDPFNISYKREKLPTPDSSGIIVYTAGRGIVPCIANGTVVRSEIIRELGGYDYDTNITARIIKSGYTKFAIVTSAGIYHRYIPTLNQLLKKCVWRIRYLVESSSIRNEKVPEYVMINKQDLFLNVLLGLTIFEPLLYAIQKFKKDRDYAWFYHPVISFIVPLVYLLVFLTNRNALSFLLKQFSSKREICQIRHAYSLCLVFIKKIMAMP